MRFPRASDPELLDVIDRYVKPATQGVGRYLHLLHGNFARDDESERTPFLQSMRDAAREITDEELEILLQSEWRSRLTASWLIGGEWGCWPLMARITATSDHVTWASFEQPHRRTRDYSGFGPFHFDRYQYDDAVNALSAAVSSEMI
ncbi:DUF6000 family protein [Streptomyces parvus]|uniref:DUF6000 family protein n=1 Tax=Streptomyces parvus TaxID=66428 RepID=UPI0033C0F708